MEIVGNPTGSTGAVDCERGKFDDFSQNGPAARSCAVPAGADNYVPKTTDTSNAGTGDYANFQEIERHRASIYCVTHASSSARSSALVETSAVAYDAAPRCIENVPTNNFLMPKTSPGRILTLIFIGLAPVISMFLGLVWLNSVLIAMFVMHWLAMTLLPVVYIQFAGNGWQYYKHIWKVHIPRVKERTFYAVIFLMLSAVFSYACYHLIKWLGGKWWANILIMAKQKAFSNGLDIAFAYLTLLSLYFSTVNPVIEEFFWRLFLYRELIVPIFKKSDGFLLLHNDELEPLLACCNFPIWTRFSNTNKNFLSTTAGKSADTPVGATPVVGRCTMDEASYVNGVGQVNKSLSDNLEEGCSDNVAYLNGCAENALPCQHHHTPNMIEGTIRHSRLHDVNISFAGHIVLALLYTSYHLVVFYHMITPIFIIPGGASLVVLGIILTLLRNSTRFGMIAALGLHIGVDVGVIVSYADLLYR